jgi:hypothetical protein
MIDLHPCWRCGNSNFWRSRDGAVHCAHCEPATAHWIIVERLRAAPVSLSAIERAIGFLQAETKNHNAVAARAIIAAARRIGIAPATLTRARWKLGLGSVKTRRGWIWTLPQP